MENEVQRLLFRKHDLIRLLSVLLCIKVNANISYDPSGYSLWYYFKIYPETSTSNHLTATTPLSSLTWITIIAPILLFCSATLPSLIISSQHKLRREVLNIRQAVLPLKPCNGSHFTHRLKAKVVTMTDLVWVL